MPRLGYEQEKIGSWPVIPGLVADTYEVMDGQRVARTPAGGAVSHVYGGGSCRAHHCRLWEEFDHVGIRSRPMGHHHRASLWLGLSCRVGQSMEVSRGMSSDRRTSREDTFERMIRDHYRGLEHFVRSRQWPSEVDEILSATLHTAWRRFDDRPRGAERGWLYRIALNTARNVGRGAQRRRAAHSELDFQRQRRSAELHDHAIPPETIELVDQALAQLGDADRDIIELVAFAGLTGSDLAAALGISVNAARVRLHRARRRLTAFYREGAER